MLTRRSFLKGLALGAGGVLLGKVTPALSVQDQRFPQGLVIGVGRDFFDGPDSRTFLHGSTNTWEALTYLDRNLRAGPWLAESWKCGKDGRTWTFSIRKGVYFHDGTPLTLDDIWASLYRMKQFPKYDPTGIYKNVVGIEKKGSTEITFILKDPSPAFPNLMAYYSSPIFKASAFNAQGHIIRFVATGPFQIEHIRRGGRIELKVFLPYWGEKPFYSRITFRTLVDAHTRLMALQSGTVDVVADVGGLLPEQARQLAGDPEVVLKRQEVATTHYLFFNCHRTPFDRKETRFWLAGLIDRKGWIQALTYGYSREVQGLYTPLAEDWQFPFRPLGRGRKPDSIKRVMTLLLSTGTVQRWPYLELAQLLQEKLHQEGVRMRIQVLETGPYQEALKKLDFDLVLQPNTLMTGDPDFFYSYYLFSKGTQNFGFRDETVDQWIIQARKTMNQGQRKILYARLAERIQEELPVLPLYHDLSCYAHRRNVARFDMDHNFHPDLIRARGRE